MTKVTFAIDGYSVGEKLLESVMFDVVALVDTIIDTAEFEILTVSPRPEDADYLEQFNMDHWLKEVLEFAIDILAEGMLGEFEYEILDSDV